MKKIGHRGAKGYVPENTLASFEKAIELGVDGVELDVHLSSDGKIVVIHDETINRTTSGKGFVKDYSSVELKKLGIPILTDVLDLIAKTCFVNIEIKDANASKCVIELVQNYISDKHWDLNLFQISSFNWEVLQLCHTQAREILLGVLTEDSIENAVVFAKKINAYSINPYFKLLNPENCQAMIQNGFKIFPWTINSKEDIIFVKSLQVDGIISDFPDRI